MLKWVILVAALFVVAQGSYVITTPRKWTGGVPTKVCLVHVNATGRADEHLKVTVQATATKTNVTSSSLPIAQGQTNKCYEVTLPRGDYGHTSGYIIIFEGEVGGRNVSHNRTLALVSENQRTFVQTDKHLYKPGQVVRFRILTMEGSLGRPSTDSYRSIYVDTPSGTRIQQWLDVDNTRGLIHQQFRLNEEVEAGNYKIETVTQNNTTSSTIFKVEEFVLPRFEVTLTPTGILMGSDTGGSFRVCARYTFGEPVKGNATLTFHGGFNRDRADTLVKTKPISGCQDIEFTYEEYTGSNERSPRLIRATAAVTEEGTGVEIKSSTLKQEVNRQALKMERISKSTSVKPSLPFSAEVAITHVNGTPAAREPMEVCASEVCKTFTTDDLGILGFNVPRNLLPHSNYGGGGVGIAAVNYLGFRDGSQVMERSYMYIDVERFVSPSNSSLLLRVPPGELDCRAGERQLILDLMFAAVNQSKANITVQVISRGQIQYQETKEYQLTASPLPLDGPYLSESVPFEGVVGALKIPVNLVGAKSPGAKVLVWYSRSNGEVVSDLAEVDIGKCLDNMVNMTWNVDKTEPGRQATLNLTAAPNSFCSFGVVDKSVELLSSGRDQITTEKVLSFFDTFSIDEEINPQSSDDEYCKRVKGAEVEEDRLRLFGTYETYVQDSATTFDASGLFYFTDLDTESRPCFPAPVILDSPVFFATRISAPSGSPRGKDEEASRTYFPETWLWDLTVVPDNGENLQDLTLPDTVTEWVGKTVCVHPQKGVGISGKSSITTFTPFFTDLTLPPSVKRGEILPVKISVFNYLEQSLPVRVILAGSSDYEIFDGEGEEVVAEGERNACVAPSEKVTRTIRITPKILGNINLTVTAFVDSSLEKTCGSGEPISKRDVLVKPIKVEAEGFPREKSWSIFICMQELENNVDSFEVWRLEPPPNFVNDSARAFVTAAGDLLVPSLENLDNLVRMPSGCGEQNMILFSPNIYVLQYLEASEQLTLDIVDRVKDNMQLGYQRELMFRHKDGSYSAFGESDDSGSTWLTAFVVKSFAQAQQYIFIDSNDLKKSIDWLKKQQTEDGCFKSVGKVFHKELKGGLSANSSGEVTLTAFVLVALLEAGEPPKSPVIEQATQCILKQETRSTYTEAITSYALALSEHPQREKVLQNLLSKANEMKSLIIWKLDAGEGVAVEVAGYALLAMSTSNYTKRAAEALKVAKAISSKRNGQGGFFSTQDTVVALQALARYSIVRDQNDVNLTVTIGAEGLKHSFSINQQNKLLQQFKKLPTLPTNVNLDMTGQGCALLQAVLRYNVPLPDPTDTFSLSVNTSAEYDQLCITKRITACASFLLPDNKPNMAILEVNLVSGYVPIKDSLKEVIKNSKLFKKFEVDGSKIMFYIDEFGNEELCASFKVKREVLVEKAKPGTVSVYDYYQPEFELEMSYEFTKECLTGFFF